MMRAFARATVVLSSFIVVPMVSAQATKTVAKPLPKAETVLEQYVEATGGKAAYEKIKNRVVTGTIEFVGANIKGKLTLTQASPNLLATLTDLGAVGKTRQGTDGKVAWEISTFTGERILEGDEKDAFVIQALFNSEIFWKDRYAKMECVGIEDVDGKPAAKLLLTGKTGRVTTEYYDMASHLVVKQIVTTKSPQGELTIEMFPSDFRKVDGVSMPFVVKQKVLGQEMQITLDEIKQNVEIPAGTFAIPKEIEAMMKKKAK